MSVDFCHCVLAERVTSKVVATLRRIVDDLLIEAGYVVRNL